MSVNLEIELAQLEANIHLCKDPERKSQAEQRIKKLRKILKIDCPSCGKRIKGDLYNQCECL